MVQKEIDHTIGHFRQTLIDIQNTQDSFQKDCERQFSMFVYDGVFTEALKKKANAKDVKKI